SSSPFTVKKPTLYVLSTSSTINPSTPSFHFHSRIPQLCFTPLSSWNGLRHAGMPISQNFMKLERKRKCKGKVVFASLFGVGAPEALVIGVVALLVFGPKGLAELFRSSSDLPAAINEQACSPINPRKVARNLGKTLREFQPTIRELQDVSREFKSTLEREIGLDDIQNPTQGNYSSKTTSTTPSPSPTSGSADSEVTVDTNGLSSPKKAYSSENYLKITEEQLKASAAVQQKSVDSPGEGQLESQAQSQETLQEAAAGMPPPQKPPKSET
ncbi:hypothetical protein RJ640_023073, partial [Escallonia rubra]